MDILIGAAAGWASVCLFTKALQQTTGQPNFNAILAGICAAVITFAVTAVTILLSVTPGARLREVLRSSGYPLIRLIMRSLLVLTVIANASAYASLTNFHTRPTLAIWTGVADNVGPHTAKNYFDILPHFCTARPRAPR